MLKATFIFILCLTISSASDAVDWPYFELEPLNLNLDKPVAGVKLPDEEAFLIAQQEGEIVRVDVHRYPSYDYAESDWFLDLREHVSLDTYEEGLLGLCLSPDFSDNGLFYTFYSRQLDGALIVSEWSLDENDTRRADFESERILLSVDAPKGYHNGGSLAFGPDGFLYIGFGDGDDILSASNDAQDPSSLMGKILRIDPSNGAPYAIPADNPFVGEPGYCEEIWAMGLRNPWRFSFDRDGQLIIADVGEASQEEVNVAAPGVGGQNYGWPFFEGTRANINDAPDIAFSAPAFTLPHHDPDGNKTGESITGGYRYRGPLPEGDTRMDNAYIFGDWASSQLFAAVETDGVWEVEVIMNTNYRQPTSFIEDSEGNLYFLDYHDGDLIKIVPEPKAHAPSIDMPNFYSSAAREVTVSTITEGATIHYTWEDREPTEDDPIVANGGTLLINRGGEIRFAAFRDDLEASPYTSGNYTLTLIEPDAHFVRGEDYEDITVTLQAHDPADRIHYTFNGDNPTESDPYLMSGDTLLIDRNGTLRIGAFRENWTPSTVDAHSFSFQVKRSYASQSSSRTLPGITLTFSDALPDDAVSHYTTDGTVATTDDPILPDSLTIENTTRLSILTTNGRYSDSTITYYYGVTHYAPRYYLERVAGSLESGYVDGNATDARFNDLQGICTDDVGNVYVVDHDNYRVRKIADGVVSTFAGNGDFITENGPRLEASFANPNGIAYLNGNLYLADNDIIRCIQADGEVVTEKDVFVGTRFTMGMKTRNSNQLIFASSNGSPYYYDLELKQTGSLYYQYRSYSAYSLAADSSGNIYQGSTRGLIQQVNEDDPTILCPTSNYLGDGTLDSAWVDEIHTMAFHEGALYFVDVDAVRRLKDGVIDTLIGGIDCPTGLGSGPAARLENVRDMAIAPNGDIYLTSLNAVYRVRQGHDSDGDGIIDELEAENPAFLVGRRDDLDDQDGDGMSNLAEALLGRNPMAADSGSLLALTFKHYGPVNDVSWPTSPYGLTTLYASPDMQTWEKLDSSGYFYVPQYLVNHPSIFFQLRAVSSDQLYQ